jgi:LPXTG-motif cell wall-anchored protein
MASTVRRALVVLGVLFAACGWAGPVAAGDDGGSTRGGVTVLPAPSGSAAPGTPVPSGGTTTPRAPAGTGTGTGSAAPPPVSNGGGSTGSLPNTGVDLAVEVGAGLALLAGGTVLIAAGRRKRGTAHRLG